MHEGHRQRMLARLAEADHLQDHELLEILLFNAVPRKNTNPAAHRLLDAFGSLDGVLRAETDALESVEGIGRETAAYLRCVGQIFARIRRSAPALPKVFSVRTFADFLTERYAGLSEEVVELFCLDGQGRLKFSKRYTSSAADRAGIACEEVSRFLAEHRPHGLVVAHNHPRARAVPSDTDDKFTAQMQLLCSLNNVAFYDHIIVGTDGTYSYYLVGRMDEIRRNFDVAALLGGRLLI